MNITEQEKKELIKLQQGELSGEIIYSKLATKVKNPVNEETLQRIAKEEHQHSEVFRSLTGVDTKGAGYIGPMIGIMFSLLGPKKLFSMTAQGQYDAAKKYESWVKQFPSLEKVITEEKQHGDILSELSKNA
jgi:rubrerythrin